TVRATSGAISGTAMVNVSYLKGDVTIDGQRDIADVTAMMGALADLSTYQMSRGLSNADITTIFDTDGATKATNADLQGLLVMLAIVGGGGSGTSAGASGSAALLPSVELTASTNLPRAAGEQSFVMASPIALPVHDRGQAMRLNPVAVLIGVGVTDSAPM